MGMEYTVTLGWWMLPALITLASMMWAFLTPVEPSGGYSFDLMPLFRFLGALIISLIAWLAWALMTS